MQPQTILSWLPQVAVTTLPGFIHQHFAARELVESLQRFPLFNPRKSPTYWVYKLFTFLLATFLFWFIVPLIFRIDAPSLQRNWKDLNLWGMALAVGFSLPYLLNAPFSILALGVFDIGPGYDKIVPIFRDTIIKAQLDRTAELWAEVGKELRTVAVQTRGQNYTDGYKALRDSLVFLIDSQKQTVSKSPLAELEARLDKILPQRFDEILPRRFRLDQSEATIQMLDWLLAQGLISRSRLPQVLKDFSCHLSVQQYFPKAPQGSRPCP